MFSYDKNQVNLSTASSASSSTLLSSVRAERLAREEQRRRERAAATIQRVWRGRAEAARARLCTLEELEQRVAGSLPGDVADEVGALLLVLSANVRWEQSRVLAALEAWCAQAQQLDGKCQLSRFAVVPTADVVATQTPRILGPLGRRPGYDVNLAIIAISILRRAAVNPRTVRAFDLLRGLEAIFVPAVWAQSGVDASLFSSVLGERGWVEILVDVMEDLIAASPPKKKHPLLQPVVRLLTAPLSLAPATAASSLVPPYIHTLLAVPSLASAIPLPSLTHLSSTLPIFSVLLPFAAAALEYLSAGRLSTELGKTYFLANLATFGITGGMLARYGVSGATSWMDVVGTVLAHVDADWGRWVEGIVDTDDDGDVAMGDSDDDDVAPTVVTRLNRRVVRDPLPPALGPKLALLAGPSHLSALASTAIAPSAPVSTLTRFATFELGLLHAFRGTPKWETVLDTALQDTGPRSLVMRLWLQGVRGQWRSDATRAGWSNFMENPSRPALLLLTHIYCHYLLLTPDDEFVDGHKNPLGDARGDDPSSVLAELLNLVAIWRDLAFWGYMDGVAEPAGSTGKGDEDVRSLFTRAVTRVAERDARLGFTRDEFWVMPDIEDQFSFVQAALADEDDLASGGHSAESTSSRVDFSSRRLSKRQVAHLSPRLGLLNNLPMAVPFQTRLEVFDAFIEADRKRLDIDRYQGSRRMRHHVDIRRSALAEDGFRFLDPLGPALKGTVQITFIDQFGGHEAGIDGGGLFKEFLTSLCQDVFDTNRGLWLSNENNQLYPNPSSYATEPHQLSWFAFIGRVLGKAIYDGMLVDVSFPDFFLAKWLGRQSYLDDLKSLDNELYKGLIKLALNFTITVDDFGEAKTIDLIPGGSELAVTADNRHDYIQLVCRYKLDKQIAAQSRAFFTGLSDMIDPKWLRMFDQRELAQLVGGEEVPIDVRDMRKHTEVTGFVDSSTPRMFWKVVKSFTEDEKRSLLRFITSCSRPPLLGFGALNPKLAIRCAGPDTDRLPSASACFNMLKLPPYTDESQMRAKILQAITSGAGFDLS